MKNNYYDSSIEYPDDCIVDFDMRLIDLFKKSDQKSLTAKERITHENFIVLKKSSMARFLHVCNYSPIWMMMFTDIA